MTKVTIEEDGGTGQGAPVIGFADLGLHEDLLQAVGAMGFTKPTPIQASAIPFAMGGRDVLACARTGTGKTAAFLLPILQRIRERPRGSTRALILTPTRELAAQIVEHLTELARGTPMTGAAIFGGVGMNPQTEALRRGVDIVVATPGRLLDHFGSGNVRFPDLEVLVLDEADRMLDMGFLPDVRRILRQLPAGRRQTLLFSATMPPPIAELARELLVNPAQVQVERKQAPAEAITQALYPVAAESKVDLLAELIRRGEIGNVIAFCRTKHRANRLAEKLEKHYGIRVARIHGNRSQAQRTEALEGFKNGRYQVLAATDIVARGIDVEALGHVVNFDVPAAPEDYIHRVGRTARAEATGDAYTFVSPEEEGDIRAIERAIGRRIERRTLADFSPTPRGERFEIPIGERIAQIKARKAEERARARQKEERRAQAGVGPAKSPAGASAGRSGGSPARGDSAREGSGQRRRRRNGGPRRQGPGGER